jgi:Zn-finger nucleic acid-binding protein
MRPFPAGRVELDRCSFCRGLWFDGGELEQVLGKKVSPQPAPGLQTNRHCPPCKTPMAPAELGGLRVEVCGTCHGIFLDEGELVALNGGKQVRVEQQAAPPPPPTEAQVKDDVAAWLDSLGV